MLQIRDTKSYQSLEIETQEKPLKCKNVSCFLHMKSIQQTLINTQLLKSAKLLISKLYHVSTNISSNISQNHSKATLLFASCMHSSNLTLCFFILLSLGNPCHMFTSAPIEWPMPGFSHSKLSVSFTPLLNTL